MAGYISLSLPTYFMNSVAIRSIDRGTMTLSEINKSRSLAPIFLSHKNETLQQATKAHHLQPSGKDADI